MHLHLIPTSFHNSSQIDKFFNMKVENNILMQINVEQGIMIDLVMAMTYWNSARYILTFTFDIMHPVYI